MMSTILELLETLDSAAIDALAGARLIMEGSDGHAHRGKDDDGQVAD